MKTPDILLNLPTEDFDLINRHFAQEDTERDLRNALYDTRKDYGGVNLEVVAQTIGSVFDSAEIEELIKLLQHGKD